MRKRLKIVSMTVFLICLSAAIGCNTNAVNRSKEKDLKAGIMQEEKSEIENVESEDGEEQSSELKRNALKPETGGVVSNLDSSGNDPAGRKKSTVNIKTGSKDSIVGAATGTANNRRSNEKDGLKGNMKDNAKVGSKDDTKDNSKDNTKESKKADAKDSLDVNSKDNPKDSEKDGTKAVNQRKSAGNNETSNRLIPGVNAPAFIGTANGTGTGDYSGQGKNPEITYSENSVEDEMYGAFLLEKGMVRICTGAGEDFTSVKDPETGKEAFLTGSPEVSVIGRTDNGWWHIRKYSSLGPLSEKMIEGYVPGDALISEEERNELLAQKNPEVQEEDAVLEEAGLTDGLTEEEKSGMEDIRETESETEIKKETGNKTETENQNGNETENESKSENREAKTKENDSETTGIKEVISKEEIISDGEKEGE